MRVKSIIMAGGSGIRLWPLSSELYPKQFIKSPGALSLLQDTLIRNKLLGIPTIITTEKYESITKAQAEEIDIKIEVITEQFPKNTAICAIITALSAKEQGFNTVMLLPADHYISDIGKYLVIINKALNYVEKLGICTIGIPIKYLSTEYGYIQAEKLFSESIYQTTHFVEKPSKESAESYRNNPNYFWNSGIYIYNIDFLLEQTRKLQPDLLRIDQQSLSTAIKNANTIKLNCDLYAGANNISLDKAIIEHIPQMIMIKASFVWSDLGSWSAVYQIKEKDITNNYCEGDIRIQNTTNSYISSNKLTIIIGLNNVIIVNTENGLLVADKSKIEELKGVYSKKS